jgi:DNA modification methylase
MEEEVKVCSRCGGEPKPVSEFHTRTNGALYSHCKSCQREYTKNHYAENRLKYIEKANKWAEHQRTTVDRIILGDCQKLMRTVSPDAYIISDPPYNQGYHYSSYKDALEIRKYQRLLTKAFKGRKSVVIHYPEDTINLLGGGALGSVEQSIAWVYNSNTAKQHRSITWFNCKPDMTKVTQPYKNPTDKRIAKRIEEGKACKLYDWWEVNQVKNISKRDNPHPCPIPYEIAERIILLTTNEGDLVCDPFAGSGTVLLAAKNLNRRYLGFEIDPVYFEYAQQQLK